MASPRWFAPLARVLLLSLLVVVVLAGTALGIAMLLGWIDGSSWADGPTRILALVCSLIVWLFIAVFHLRRETISLPVPDRLFFVDQVKAALEDLGYDLKAETAESLSYKPRFRSFVLGGGVQVHLSEQTGKLTGPKFWVEILRKRLRIRNHLDHVHQAIEDSRRRLGERLLSRVHVRFRFAPEQWQKVQRHVVGPLSLQANVICELNVLAHSEAGILESVVDAQIRPWLSAHGIAAEVHKDAQQGSGQYRISREQLRV